MNNDRTKEEGLEKPGNVIIFYSRTQAIACGLLIDVTETARKAGFKVSVALTAAAWDRCVNMTPAAEKAGNSVDGRLWDVLQMGYLAAHFTPEPGEVLYPVLVVTDSPTPEEVQLKIRCSSGEQGEPVITIMLPEEE